MNLEAIVSREGQTIAGIAFSVACALAFLLASKYADKLFGGFGKPKIVWSYAERLDVFKKFCRFFFYIGLLSAAVYAVILIYNIATKP